MKSTTKSPTKDDKVVFTDESDSIVPTKDLPAKKFKLLIVDDEKEVHIMTKLVLSDYSYKGFTLDFHSAYSGKEAKKLIKDNPDAACILLDVVMETKDAGLEIARFIREDEKNDRIRIILRTGQPGKAPEKDIILNYDINDYKEKTELTTQKLFTTVTTALRSHLHLIDLDEKKDEITAKNIRLNEEIARRIVAESNLTKYNRSLEKMIDNKSIRLKTALRALELKEKELQKANKLADVGDLSCATIVTLDHSNEALKGNLDTIDKFRIDMTVLLEKYETLQNIIVSHSDTSNDLSVKKQNVMVDIDQFKKDIDLKDILAKYPEIIKDSTKGIEHISRAVNDIKLFISINDEPLEKTDINSLLKSVLNNLKAQINPKIEIQTDFGKIPRINIAPKNMENAFFEIIKNAFQAIKHHGIISISSIFEASEIIIQISDMGIGITPEHLQDVFKPYFTTGKANAKGLGLSFAKSVILNNNGMIDISSTPREGTNINIKFIVDS